MPVKKHVAVSDDYTCGHSVTGAQITVQEQRIRWLTLIETSAVEQLLVSPM